MKKHEIPDEIVELFTQHVAFKECMNASIKTWFKYKRAAYFAKKATKKKQEAFHAIYELYPELRGKELSHYPGDKFIVEN